MRSPRPTRALVWKEWRELAMPLAGALTALVLAHAVLSDYSAWGEILVLLIAPLAATVFGAVSIAGESSGGAPAFLRARPVAVASILRIKVAVHAMAALVFVAVAVALAANLSLGDERHWSAALDAPASIAWILCVALVLTSFAWGVALSLVLPDGLTAAPAAVIAACAWSGLVLLPAVGLAGSLEVGLSALPLAIPLLVAPPALLAWKLARRQAWIGAGPASRNVNLGCIAIGMVSGALFGRALDEPMRARLVLLGEATASASPVIAATNDSAVAFIATPAGHAPRTVIALVDRERTLQSFVLAAGTVPVAWSPLGSGFVVEWPDGARRVVTLAGDIETDSAFEDAGHASTSGPGSFEVRDGRLVGRGATVFYGPESEVSR